MEAGTPTEPAACLEAAVSPRVASLLVSEGSPTRLLYLLMPAVAGGSAVAPFVEPAAVGNSSEWAPDFGTACSAALRAWVGRRVPAWMLGPACSPWQSALSAPCESGLGVPWMHNACPCRSHPVAPVAVTRAAGHGASWASAPLETLWGAYCLARGESPESPACSNGSPLYWIVGALPWCPTSQREMPVCLVRVPWPSLAALDWGLMALAALSSDPATWAGHSWSRSTSTHWPACGARPQAAWPRPSLALGLLSESASSQAPRASSHKDACSDTWLVGGPELGRNIRLHIQRKVPPVAHKSVVGRRPDYALLHHLPLEPHSHVPVPHSCVRLQDGEGDRVRMLRAPETEISQKALE